MTGERLQKIIAQAGVCSRRAAEAYIVEGRVRVNGEVVRTLGTRADLTRDRVEVQGHGALAVEPRVYLAMHKPVHVVSTARDPEGRVTLIDLLEKSRATGGRRFEAELPRVFPIGRLDFDAEGIILLTNDGQLSNQLMHPRFHAPKTYVVKVKGRVEARDLERLRRGVRLPEGEGRWSKRTAPAEVVVQREVSANTWLEMTLVEGRNHQVKRMCQAIGKRVIRLVRTDFAGISVDPLPAGAWRFLSEAEVGQLRAWGQGVAGGARSRTNRKRQPWLEKRQSKGA